MPRKTDAIDRRPGALPEIRSEGDHLIFELTVATGVPGANPMRLVLRCTDNGDVLAAIDYHSYHSRPRSSGPSF